MAILLRGRNTVQCWFNDVAALWSLGCALAHNPCNLYDASNGPHGAHMHTGAQREAAVWDGEPGCNCADMDTLMADDDSLLWRYRLVAVETTQRRHVPPWSCAWIVTFDVIQIFFSEQPALFGLSLFVEQLLDHSDHNNHLFVALNCVLLPSCPMELYAGGEHRE